MTFNKYHVVLDTTNLFTSDFKVIDFNKPLTEFKEFVEQYGEKKVLIHIPKMVRDERINQNVRKFIEYKDKILSSYEKIKESGLTLNLDKLTSFKYEQNIKKQLESSAKKYGFKSIAYPKIDSKILFERFFQRKKPFSQNTDVEKGFKDSYIWLSVLEFAKTKKNDKIILITENSKDFTAELEKEFKKSIGSDIEIFYSIEDAKGYLDAELDLKLELKRKYNRIKAIIEEQIGSIMIKINSETQSVSSSDVIYGLNKQIYTAFTLSSIDYIEYVSNIDYLSIGPRFGETNTVKVNLKLKGYYKQTDTDSYLNEHLLPKSVRVGMPMYDNNYNTRLGMKEKNIDAEIEVSINKFTDELTVGNISMKESLFQY